MSAILLISIVTGLAITISLDGGCDLQTKPKLGSVRTSDSLSVGQFLVHGVSRVQSWLSMSECMIQ